MPRNRSVTALRSEVRRDALCCFHCSITVVRVRWRRQWWERSRADSAGGHAVADAELASAGHHPSTNCWNASGASASRRFCGDAPATHSIGEWNDNAHHVNNAAWRWAASNGADAYRIASPRDDVCEYWAALPAAGFIVFDYVPGIAWHFGAAPVVGYHHGPVVLSRHAQRRRVEHDRRSRER
jgi:hypothetical protein